MMNLLGVNGVASITIIIYTQFLLTTLFIGFQWGLPQSLAIILEQTIIMD